MAELSESLKGLYNQLEFAFCDLDLAKKKVEHLVDEIKKNIEGK